MKKGNFLILAACSVIFSISSVHAKQLPLAEVPKIVIEAAKSAVAGFEVLTAEKEREWGRLVYELSGVSSEDGVFYEIEITPKGKVLEIEKSDRMDEDDEDEAESSEDD